ncbi:MAG: hypothetical protein LBI27_05055 [Clostridiales bacterium]|jgi:hypothetical protein|nr:hypothetical protein [Clostridiales bacterium]
MKKFFKGWYFKQQSNGKTLAVIPGRTADGAFIQIITDSTSYNIPFSLNEYKENKVIQIGESSFSNTGIKLRIEKDDISLRGDLEYCDLTPINGDIMGPFRFFPMECRHGIVSMKHDVRGEIIFNGEKIDFGNGIGYIETDSGFSFPEGYTWIHSNEFKQNASIVAAVARIPFYGLRFWGVICVVWLDGKEYRLATYRGAKIIRRTQDELIIKQGNFRLQITVNPRNAQALAAPNAGTMNRIIKESASCPAQFLFTEKNKIIFFGESLNASYEWQPPKTR